MSFASFSLDQSILVRVVPHTTTDIIIENEPNRYIIFSDSLSVLTSLKSKNMTNLLITKLLNSEYCM